jgi:hypothetical protein
MSSCGVVSRICRSSIAPSLPMPVVVRFSSRTPTELPLTIDALLVKVPLPLVAPPLGQAVTVPGTVVAVPEASRDANYRTGDAPDVQLTAA